MPPSITRLLTSLRRPRTRRPADLHTARDAMLQAVADCQGMPVDQLKLKIRGARHHRDLWMLRSEAYHLIALQHCQSIAEERIRELLHLFEGWMAPQELNRLV